MRTLLLLALLAGCTAAPHSAPTPDTTVHLTVHNSASEPMKVYQVVGTTHVRLDVVQVQIARTFKLPPRPDNTFTFYVIPFAGSQGYTLGPIPAQKGDDIDLNLQDYLPLSMFSVRAH